MYGFGTFGGGGFGSLLTATETPSAPSISLSIRASSSASCLSGLSRGGLITARANSVAGVLGAPLTGHSLSARAASASTAKAQANHSAHILWNVVSDGTVKAQADKAARLVARATSQSRETLSVSKEAPIVALAGRSSTTSSQCVSVLGWHSIAAHASSTCGARFHVLVQFPTSSLSGITLEFVPSDNVLVLNQGNGTITLLIDINEAILEDNMKTGDTGSSLNFALKRSGTPVNLAGYTITVIGKIGSVTKVSKAPTITDAAKGLIEITLDADESDSSGLMLFEIHMLDTNGKKHIFPSTGFPSVTIENSLVAD